MIVDKYLLVCLFVVAMQYAFDVNSSTPDSSEEQRLDGQYLLDMGKRFNNPLLKLMGQVVLNGEKNMTDKLCVLHPCSEWGTWTECLVKRGFSMVKRSRVCYKPTDLCTFDDKSELTQTESKVCQGNCPAGYNDTNGFCLKFVQSTMTQWDAETECQLDGGHLVNINTQSKSEAVHALFPSQSYSGTVWINGNRTNTASSWVLTYGSSLNFENWSNNEPSNGTAELCRVEENVKRIWYDRECNKEYRFVCETY